MLADELDFIVGVDSHRDSHALGVVEVRSGVVVFEASVTADSGGYAEALRLAAQHASGRRAFAIEGTGSFGAGLTRFLADHGEQVFEVGRLRRERRSGGKTDALDAVRAARSVLGQKRPARPRRVGEREALRVLMAAREGAVNAKRAGLCQLHDLLVTASRRPTRRAVDRRGAGARQGDREAHPRARTTAARPARRRPTRGRTGRALLVTPRPHRERSRVCTSCRRRSDPRLFRPDDPLPPRPQRRQKAQSSPPPDHPHQTPSTPTNDRLHRAENQRREEPPRGHPLPQALPRSQPLPDPREPATHGLTNIEASDRSGDI